MKKLVVVLLVLSSFSCRKQEPSPPPSLTEISTTLSSDRRFISFAENYLHTILKFARYQKSVLGKNEPQFIAEMQNALPTVANAERIYLKYGIDFQNVITCQNAIDNAMLRLYKEQPVIAALSETDTRNAVLNAITMGIKSQNQAWMPVITELSPKGMANPSGKTPKSSLIYVAQTGLTAGEVWECVLKSIGINFGFQYGMKKMVAEEIIFITRTLTTTVAKFAGPIGTAILFAELGYCLYEEAED